MKLSEILIKVGGLVLFFVGLALVLSAIGLSFFGIGLEPAWLAVLIGVVMIGVGIWIIRGGSITL